MFQWNQPKSHIYFINKPTHQTSGFIMTECLVRPPLVSRAACYLLLYSSTRSWYTFGEILDHSCTGIHSRSATFFAARQKICGQKWKVWDRSSSPPICQGKWAKITAKYCKILVEGRLELFKVNAAKCWQCMTTTDPQELWYGELKVKKSLQTNVGKK